MKKRTPVTPLSEDTPATRNRRLRQRLREMDERNTRELTMLEKGIERIKTALHSKKSNGGSS